MYMNTVASNLSNLSYSLEYNIQVIGHISKIVYKLLREIIDVAVDSVRRHDVCWCEAMAIR